MKTIFSKTLPVLLLTLLFGCLPNQAGLSHHSTPLAVIDEGNLAARISFFLSLKDVDVPPISFTMEDLEVLSGEKWVSVLPAPLTIQSDKINSSQVFIARKTVSAGDYEKIRVRISKAETKKTKGNASYRVADPVIEFSLGDGLSLANGESRSLFLNWDVQKSIEKIAFFSLQLTPYLQNNSLVTDTAYVACPDIDTVYRFRTDTNKVTGSIGVKGRPIFPATSNDEAELYILTALDPGITVIETTTGKIKNRLSLPMIQEPSFFIVNSRDNEAFILDQKNRYLFRVTLDTGNIAAQRHFDNKISYITFLNDTNRLAVSSPLDQQIIFLDATSLATIANIGTGGGADGLFADENMLYIAAGINNNIAIVDLKTQKLHKLPVSAMPTRITKAGDRFYVSNYRGGVLSTFFPGSFNVLRNIKVGGRPTELAFSAKRRWLYVSNEPQKGLNVVDLGNSRPTGFIALGSGPKGMVVLQ